MSGKITLEAFTATYKKTNPDATDEDVSAAWKVEEFTVEYRKTNPKATDKDVMLAWSVEQAKDLNLTDKISKVMDDYGSMLITQMEVRLQKRIDEVIAATQDELVGAIRKGVGLDEDPVIHLSEVTSVVRKILLDQDSGKKTLDKGGDGPPGAGPINPRTFDIEKQYAEMNKGRTI